MKIVVEPGDILFWVIEDIADEHGLTPYEMGFVIETAAGLYQAIHEDDKDND